MRSRITKLGLVAGLMLAVCTAFAQSPTYASFSASGSSSAEVIVPADPTGQIRLVGVIASSDLATSVVKVQAATTPCTILATNAATVATNVTVGSYSGFSTNDYVIISNGTTNRTMQIYGLANSTNMVFTAAIGFNAGIGAQVYDLTAATTTLAIGAKTNVGFAGEAVYVAPKGRPLRVTSTGTSYTSLDSVTVHYDY